MSSMDLIKDLRERSGAGMMDCKKALLECDNDIEKAMEYLRKKGIAKAAKRGGRVASEGLVQSYIHGNGKIGVLLELNCETDFVAKTDEFKALALELSLQIAAASPRYVSREAVPTESIEKEKVVLKEQAESSGKKGPFVDKIVEGRLNKFFEETCLMEQPFIKDSGKNIDTLIKETIGRLGENITVRRFARFQVGEGVVKETEGTGAGA